MQTTTFISTCLSYDKLKAYSEHTISKTERELCYLHLSSCELCACAVNGFSAIAITMSDINELHKKIDIKSNTTFAKPHIVARVLIVIISLLSIVGIYSISNRVDKKSALKKNTSIKVPSIVNANDKKIKEIFTEQKQKAIASQPHLIPHTNTENKSPKTEQIQKITAPILLPDMKIKEIRLPEKASSESETNAFVYNSQILYIHDLKVTEYTNLYFKHENPRFEYKNFLPSYKENNDETPNDFSIEHESHAAHQLLKQGLYYFSKEKYNDALANFSFLLEHNKSDINANFYAALCYFNLNKTEKAIHLLTRVLEKSNNTFLPEAEWHLALCYLKTGEREKTKTLLQKIHKEKGFYAKRASELLYRLSEN